MVQFFFDRNLFKYSMPSFHCNSNLLYISFSSLFLAHLSEDRMGYFTFKWRMLCTNYNNDFPNINTINIFDMNGSQLCVFHQFNCILSSKLHLWRKTLLLYKVYTSVTQLAFEGVVVLFYAHFVWGTRSAYATRTLSAISENRAEQEDLQYELDYSSNGDTGLDHTYLDYQNSELWHDLAWIGTVK